MVLPRLRQMTPTAPQPDASFVNLTRGNRTHSTMPYSLAVLKRLRPIAGHGMLIEIGGRDLATMSGMTLTASSIGLPQEKQPPRRSPIGLLVPLRLAARGFRPGS